MKKDNIRLDAVLESKYGDMINDLVAAGKLRNPKYNKTDLIRDLLECKYAELNAQKNRPAPTPETKSGWVSSRTA